MSCLNEIRQMTIQAFEIMQVCFLNFFLLLSYSVLFKNLVFFKSDHKISLFFYYHTMSHFIFSCGRLFLWILAHMLSPCLASFRSTKTRLLSPGVSQEQARFVAHAHTDIPFAPSSAFRLGVEQSISGDFSRHKKTHAPQCPDSLHIYIYIIYKCPCWRGSLTRWTVVPVLIEI